MCKKKLLLLAFLVFFGISSYAEAVPVDEWLYTAQDIITLSQKQSFDSGDIYTLKQDIDMSGYTLQHTIGYSGAFLGKFYGHGHSIKNLTIVSINDSIGFFSKNNGTISNLILENAKIVGHDYVGGMIAVNQGHIDSCKFVGGDVTGNDYVGGLVGYNSDGTVKLSSSSGEVAGYDVVGGLVGRAYAPGHVIQVQTSSSSCSVTGHNCVGGLIGFYVGSDIVNCYYRFN